jgi:hypothetical protein
MVGERRWKHLDRGACPEVKGSRPAGDRLSVLVETVHETSLRAAMDAARIDAIVIGCRTIAVKAKMDLILSDRGVSADERSRRA